jgi:hypothetical protein
LYAPSKNGSKPPQFDEADGRLLAQPGPILRPHDLNATLMLPAAIMAVKRKFAIFSGNFNISLKKHANFP